MKTTTSFKDLASRNRIYNLCYACREGITPPKAGYSMLATLTGVLVDPGAVHLSESTIDRINEAIEEWNKR